MLGPLSVLHILDRRACVPCPAQWVGFASDVKEPVEIVSWEFFVAPLLDR